MSRAPDFRRLPVTLRPDPGRVLIRPFAAADLGPPHPGGRSQGLTLLSRILAMTETEVERQWSQVQQQFDPRHAEFEAYCLRRFEDVSRWLPSDAPLSESRRMVIGSYFTQEYALEAAALFNPSIVACPDQSNLEEGSLRFVLSLRAVGEGHVSSLEFRCGTLTAGLEVEFTQPARWLVEPEHDAGRKFDRAWFRGKCLELGVDCGFLDAVLERLPEAFDRAQVIPAVEATRGQSPQPAWQAAGDRFVLLARNNFAVDFSPEQRFSERVIFPVSPSQTNGIEDARFVRFLEDDGTVVYYAPYTAYDGALIFPQLLETSDFLHFEFRTLTGDAVQNKGMALFPRRIDGRYAMLSRQDNENIRLMFSESRYRWDTSEVLVRPTQPWEFVKMGNCGSPIELEEGWLVLTHGVGAMRRYCIGALLLDKRDPSKIIGRLEDPLIRPEENEAAGYVPNVVYTCGGLVHRGHLILPFATSDWFTSFGVIPVADLVNAMA
jgi:predicted GH43/DUF377 family glycosyl hydrolase